MAAEIGLADATWLGKALRAHQEGDIATAAENWASISSQGLDAIRERFATFADDITMIAAAAPAPDSLQALTGATLPELIA